jgi:hypothetical protein
MMLFTEEIQHDGFSEFWFRYPRKIARADALKAWRKLRPDTQTQQAIWQALEVQVRCKQWREGGNRRTNQQRSPGLRSEDIAWTEPRKLVAF